MSEEQTDIIEQTIQKSESTDGKDLIRCPCCGKFTLKQPLTPNQQFSDHWLACMLSGIPFNHTYPLYDGRLLITVTQLSAEAAGKIDIMGTALDMLIERAGGYIDGVDIAQTRNMARLYISIKDITVRMGNGQNHIFKPAETVMEAADLIIGVRTLLKDDDKRDEWLPAISKAYDLMSDPVNTSSVHVQLLIAVADTHIRLNSIMLDLGLDKNFWKGIELV